MRSAALLALAAASLWGCTQIAGVQNVTFTGDSGSSAHDGGPLGDTDASTGLPVEDCPPCNGVMCCSPQRCDPEAGCCSDRNGPCSTNTDCCDGTCDTDAGRCTGPCLANGANGCINALDCCNSGCDSTGHCGMCQVLGAGCTSDRQCCYSLACTGSEAGVCFMP